MKYVVVINLSLIFANVQCDVTLVETVTGESHKVAGFIYGHANDRNASSRGNAIDRAIKIISNASQLIENNVKETVSTKIKIGEPQNLNVSEHNPINTRLQAKVEMNFVNKYKKNVSINNLTATGNKNNEILTTFTTINSETQTNTEPNLVENTTNDGMNTDVVIEQTVVNTNVLFSGPTYRPNVTYTSDVMVLQANDNQATRDEVLVPDKKNYNARNDTTIGYPDGMVMTHDDDEKLVNQDGLKTKYRMGFVGRCLYGYGRAPDMSCQRILDWGS